MKSPRVLASGTATINMTPMIDVVFLLIIFFLVSSHLAKQENSVALDLPVADTGVDSSLQPETIVVNVLRSGVWQIGGVDVEDAILPAMLLRRLEATREPLRLKIRTDKTVPYKRLEPILRGAAEVGIGDIVFSVYESKGR